MRRGVTPRRYKEFQSLAMHDAPTGARRARCACRQRAFSAVAPMLYCHRLPALIDDMLAARCRDCASFAGDDDAEPRLRAMAISRGLREPLRR